MLDIFQYSFMGFEFGFIFYFLGYIFGGFFVVYGFDVFCDNNNGIGFFFF